MSIGLLKIFESSQYEIKDTDYLSKHFVSVSV